MGSTLSARSRLRDLTAWRPSARATGVEDKHFVDKHRGELIQRVNNTAAILDELLSEHVIQRDSYDEIRALPTSQQIMRELFSGPLAHSGVQGKATFYKILSKHESYLIDDLKRAEYENAMKVETMTSIKMLCEILNDLNPEELDNFKSLIELEKDIPPISRSRLKAANTQDTVELMVETYSEECVELTKKILKKMNRTDLVQRLSDTGSGSKEKQWPSLIQRVETITSVIELLLETLAGLSDKELKKFKEVLLSQTDFHYSYIQRMLLRTADMQDTVFLMVQTCGQQSVETTEEVLKKMKKTDLVQRMSDSSSGPKKKHSVDEHLSALIHKVATRRAVKELLLETLRDLRHGELKKFKLLLQFTFFQRSLELISWSELTWADRTDQLVDLMLERCSQQSVEVTMEVLMDMNRTDLVQRLSETSSGHKAAGSSAEAFGVSTMEGEKHCVDEHWPALIQKVETMTSVIELLLETLAALSDEELEKFKHVLLSQTYLSRHFSHVECVLQEIEDRQDTVFLMVLIDGQQSVEITKEVLKNMERTDLVQRMSDSSSGPKKKHSDEHRSALIQKVATMAAVKHLLLETLNDLSHNELKKFKWSLEWIVSQKNLPDFSPWFSDTADREEIVDGMLQTYSQQSVQLTREAVKKMNRTDLMQRLSKPSSELKEKHSVDEHLPAVLEKAAGKQILLETLKDLSDEELEKFKCLLQFTQFQKGLPCISWRQLQRADSLGALVDLMVQICGQQSVEVTKEVFMDMNRTDLVNKLSVISSGIEGKGSSERLQKEVTMTPLKKKLLETLEDLSPGELEKFKHVLQYTKMETDLPKIPGHQMETAGRFEIVELMVKIYGQQSVEVTRKVLMMINRTDLAEMLSIISSGLEGPSRSLELEGCGSIMQGSSDWTKVQPEVNSADADEASIYSLQSEAGNFECSVSGLRWVCKEKVSFKYQFCSLRGHLERIESMKYMPAGPLMDITVTAGKLDVVYLPHWICIDDNPTILDKFAVLHIDDCGDAVEKVSEVTSSHVKLSEPVFSLKMVLVKMGLPVEIYCMVLIYSKILKASSQTTLKLHVYLIPCDLGLQEELGSRKKSHGFSGIEKSNPEKSLKMLDWFVLTTDQDGAEIYPKGEKPQTLKLRYNSTGPNFYEVVIKNPDKDFKLMLTPENGHQPVWTCEVLQGEWQITAASPSAGASGADTMAQGKHFVDKHREELINRVCETSSVLDALLENEVIQQGKYDEILAIPTHRDRMRKLYSGPLNSAGDVGKDILLKILKEKEKYLIKGLMEP